MSRAKVRGSCHYVVMLTKAQRQALLAMLEPLALSPEDYAVKTRTHALAAYDRLVSAAPVGGRRPRPP